MRLAAGVLAVLVVLAGAGSAWRLGLLPSSAVGVSELRPVSLPDLSALEPEPRAQIEAAHAELTALTGGPAHDPAALAALAAAHGKFGALLLAYDQPRAEAPLANAEALAPQEPRWPYYLGLVHRQAGDFERAAADYERTLILMPDYAAAKIRVARVYRELGRDDEAAEILESAVAADPKLASAHELLGQIAADRGDPQTAITHYEAVLALQPGASAAHSPLALAYAKVGRSDKRREHLARLGKVLPTLDDPMDQALQQLKVGVNAWLVRAYQALQAGRPADAIKLYRNVVAADPKNARAYLNLGVALSQEGDQAGAISAIRAAVAADPANAELHQMLADQLAAASQPEAAESAYREALARDPKNAKAQLGLAESLRKRGRCAEALPNYASAVDLSATDTIVRVRRVLCLVTLDRYAEARAELEAAHADFPNDPEILDALVRVLAAAPDGAVRDGAKALVLANSLQSQRQGIDAKESMAMALAATGAFDDAIEWQKAAIDMAQKDNNKAWLEALRANLDRYQKHEPAPAPWPPFLLTPAMPSR